MKWPKSLNWGLIEKLTDEERGDLLASVVCMIEDIPFDKDVSSGVTMALHFIGKDIQKSKTAAETGKLGGNPALKKGKRSSAPKTDTSQEPEKPKQETVADKINAYTENAELRDALKAFSEMRAKQRKPLTPRAMALLLTALDSLSRNESEKVKIVNQSIVHGWQSVYALKPDYGTQRNDVRPGLRPAKELTDEDMEREYALGALNLDLLIKD